MKYTVLGVVAIVVLTVVFVAAAMSGQAVFKKEVPKDVRAIEIRTGEHGLAFHVWIRPEPGAPLQYVEIIIPHQTICDVHEAAEQLARDH